MDSFDYLLVTKNESRKQDGQTESPRDIDLVLPGPEVAAVQKKIELCGARLYLCINYIY